MLFSLFLYVVTQTYHLYIYYVLNLMHDFINPYTVYGNTTIGNMSDRNATKCIKISGSNNFIKIWSSTVVYHRSELL